jgi:hypothetical protein
MGTIIRLGPPTQPSPARGEILDHSRTELVGAVLRWKRYRRWTASWLTGRCEFCESQFTEGGTPGLISGYSVVGGGPAGQDDYHWICAVCFETWRDEFAWTVLDTRDEEMRPPDLLESMLDSGAWWPTSESLRPEVPIIADPDPANPNVIEIYPPRQFR